MNTLAAVGIAGAAGVALYFVAKKTATPAAPPVPQSVPTSGSGVKGFLDTASNRIGTAIGGAIGAGPASGAIGRASTGFVRAEYNAWSQAGTGAKQIFSGNIVSGGKNVIVGGAKTAIAPITGVYNTFKGIL